MSAGEGQRDIGPAKAAQAQMRRDMEAETRVKAEPVTLAKAFEDTVGVSSVAGPNIQAMAYETINEAPDWLHLSMKQWTVVQDLVEKGIYRALREHGVA